jgi:hypothetical protein
MDAFDDLDDVTGTYANFDIAPELMEQLEVARHEPSQGSAHPRRIFALTATGRLVFEQETGRLRRAVFLAQTRLPRPAQAQPHLVK